MHLTSPVYLLFYEVDGMTRMLADEGICAVPVAEFHCESRLAAPLAPLAPPPLARRSRAHGSYAMVAARPQGPSLLASSRMAQLPAWPRDIQSARPVTTAYNDFSPALTGWPHTVICIQPQASISMCCAAASTSYLVNRRMAAPTRRAVHSSASPRFDCRRTHGETGPRQVVADHLHRPSRKRPHQRP